MSIFLSFLLRETVVSLRNNSKQHCNFNFGKRPTSIFVLSATCTKGGAMMRASQRMQLKADPCGERFAT